MQSSYWIVSFSELFKVQIFIDRASQILSRAQSYLLRLKECASAYLYQPTLPPFPPHFSSPLSSPVWALCGALQCHRYDRSTLSAQEIPLFVCSPPKGVKLSSWQLTRPLDSALLPLPVSLSLSLHGSLPPVHLHPQTSENQYQIAWGPLFGVGLTPRCPPLCFFHYM